MALILGTEYCKIDSNGRFRFPIAFKRQLESDICHFYIRRSLSKKYLELWTSKSFQEEADMLTNKLNKFDPKDLQILRKLLYVSPIIDLDSNDRLLIPQEFKSVLGNAKEIVLQSIGPCIEIWERSAYEKMNEDADDIESLVSKRLGNCNGIPSASDAE